MIEETRKFGRTDIVSSVDHRDFSDRMIAEMSNQYHRTLALTGKANALAACLSVTNTAMLSLMNGYLDSVPSTTKRVSASTTPLYPSSLSEYEYAERFPEFGTIIAKRISSRPVFVDEYGSILSYVDVVRTTNNALFLARPDRLVEGSTKNMLAGNVPYTAKFERQDMTRSNITLSLVSRGNPFAINALRYIPMPSAGVNVLDYVRSSSVVPLVQNGDVEFDDVTSSDDASVRLHRTVSGYLHFEQVTTANLKLSVSSDVYVPDLGAVFIGISSLMGEMNVYAVKSYIGYEIELPSGTTLISRGTIAPDHLSSSVSGVRALLYDNLADFNAVSRNYLAAFSGDEVLGIRTNATTMYLLLEITASQNTTPCVGKVDLEVASV